MPKGTSAPGKSSPRFVVPMNGLTSDAGFATRVAAWAVDVRAGRYAAAHTSAPVTPARKAVLVRGLEDEGRLQNTDLIVDPFRWVPMVVGACRSAQGRAACGRAARGGD